MLDSILSQLTLTAEKLLADPALWLCATLLAYALGMWVYKKSGYKTICTPLLVAIVPLVVTLEVTGTDYKTYLNGGQHINFLLGPATVALAVPLYEQRLRLAKMWVALTCGLIAGGTVAIVSAVLIAGVLGASPETMISLAPKSVTVPIAMAVRTLGRYSGFDGSPGGDHGCCGFVDGARLVGTFEGKGRCRARLFHRLSRSWRRHRHSLSDESRHGRILRSGNGADRSFHCVCRSVPAALSAELVRISLSVVRLVARQQTDAARHRTPTPCDSVL